MESASEGGACHGPLVADEPVKATNDEACECKRAAAALGYWQDGALPLVGGRRSSLSRNPPEINRGYYARVQGIRLFVDNFLAVSLFLHSFLQCHMSQHLVYCADNRKQLPNCEFGMRLRYLVLETTERHESGHHEFRRNGFPERDGQEVSSDQKKQAIVGKNLRRR